MFDKNGNWSSDFYPEQDRDNEVPITASKFQTLIQDNMKQSFENCLLRDGTGLPTDNLNLNRKKITNLSNGTSEFDAVNKGQLDSAMATNATEESLGTVRIATEEEALTGEDDTTAVSPLKAKAILSTLATSTRFAVNGGNATDGKPDLLVGIATPTLSFKVDNGTSYKPLVATTAEGKSFQLKTIVPVDVSGLVDSDYNVFVKSDGTAVVYANTVYRQQSQPAQSNTNDIWFNTCEPNKAYIKDSLGWEETELVQIPQTITIKSNVISAIETIAYFNDNGSEKAIASNYEGIKRGLSVDYSAGVSVSWDQENTAVKAGILFANIRLYAHNSAIFKLNDKSHAIPAGVGGSYASANGFMAQFLLSEGDTYQFTGSYNIQEIIFYPFKGVI